MGSVLSERTDQLVPNWYVKTIRDTTPMPNARAKSSAGKRTVIDKPVCRCEATMLQGRQDSLSAPMINAGKMKWNETVKANGMRASGQCVKVIEHDSRVQ